MNTLDAIFGRRSIRKFTSETISEEKIELLLKAGMAAPTARNTLAWEFIVIDDKKIFEELQIIQPYSTMLSTASHAILVCGDRNLEDADGYNAINTSAITQNILLAAHEVGLGTCWIGIYPREERVKGVAELFKLPDHIIPVNLIAIGYPAEEKKPNDRYYKERIHRNIW